MGNLRSTDAGLRTADTARLDIAPTEAWSYAPTSRYESSFKHPAAALLVAALVLVGGPLLLVFARDRRIRAALRQG